MENINLDVHKLFNELPRHSYPFNHYLESLPNNGIYVKFQKGEHYEDFDRIVRIGTDTAENQLQSRLQQHFLEENQRRSIFRKHIGRCFLNQSMDGYLKYWNLKFTSKLDKERNSKFIDIDFELNIEKQISDYIQTNFTFCVFELTSKSERLFWESKIIATLAQGTQMKPSANWLGHHSPKKRIKESGLWHIQGLNGEKLSRAEFNELDGIIKNQKFTTPVRLNN